MSISISNNSIKYKDADKWVGLNNVINGVKELPTVGTSDNGKVLKVINGKWELGQVSIDAGDVGGVVSGDFLPLSGGSISSDKFAPLTITRSGSNSGAALGFVNDDGILGYIGMGGVDKALCRWSSDKSAYYGILDTGNYTNTLDARYSLSSHAHNYAGSSSVGGAANSANILNQDTRMDYGWNGVNYFNLSGTAGKAAKVNDTPTTAWWHIMRFNHGNTSGFYTDLAIPFNDVSLYYKRVTSGAVQNNGWVKVLDSLNYSSYCAPASHTHSYLPLSGGSISGNLSVNGVIQAYHIYDTPLSYGIGTGSAQTYPYVQFRGSGNVGSNRELSLVYYNASGTAYFNKLMDTNGNLCLRSASATLNVHATTHVSISANGCALYFGKGLDNASLSSLTPRTTAGAAYDNKIVLGAASSRFMQIYCAKSSLSTSDVRDKNIFELDSRYKDLFMKLNTVGFTWKDEDCGTVHIGIGAQHAEKAALECGLATHEFGAIQHDYWATPGEDGRVDRYSVAYDEIAMLTVPFVQSHEKEIVALKEENLTLKTELAELKSMVQQLINK